MSGLGGARLENATQAKNGRRVENVRHVRRANTRTLLEMDRVVVALRTPTQPVHRAQGRVTASAITATLALTAQHVHLANLLPSISHTTLISSVALARRLLAFIPTPSILMEDLPMLWRMDRNSCGTVQKRKGGTWALLLDHLQQAL